MRIDQELFRTGVPLIDRQHEAYLALVERVFALCALAHVDRAQLAAEVGHALTYAVEHFATEEQLMLAVKYPLYRQHLAKHDQFRAQVDRFAAELTLDTLLDNYTARLAKWLVDWFAAQVQTDDLRLAAFLRKHPADWTATALPTPRAAQESP